MKLWLAKFRISTAMDEKKRLSPSMQRKLASSAELRQFVNDAGGLENALKQAPPTAAPGNLHRDIMRAVRAAGQVAARPSAFQLPRWIPATAIALLILLGSLWFTMHRSTEAPSSAGGNENQSLATATTALDEGSQRIRAIPTAAMEPLVAELAHMQRDLDGVTQHLLASLP